MATEIEYALIAGYAYHTTRDEINWFPAPPKPKGVNIAILSEPPCHDAHACKLQFVYRIASAELVGTGAQL